MTNEKDKILIEKFFGKVNSFLELFNNATDKWKVLPECNTYISELYKIGREISIKDEKINKNFEDMILDLESMIAMQRNDEGFSERYKDFISKFN